MAKRSIRTKKRMKQARKDKLAREAIDRASITGSRAVIAELRNKKDKSDADA